MYIYIYIQRERENIAQDAATDGESGPVLEKRSTRACRGVARIVAGYEEARLRKGHT